MSDFETFAKHWERAVNGLTGRITNEENGLRFVYTEEGINEMWQEELLAHRFRAVGVRDEAQVFLDDLFAREPGTAKQLLDKLQASRLNVGIKAEKTAVKGVSAVVCTAVAAAALNRPDVDFAAKVVGWLGAAGGLTAAGSVVADVASGARQPIIKSIREEARKQLEEYRALLGG